MSLDDGANPESVIFWLRQLTAMQLRTKRTFAHVTETNKGFTSKFFSPPLETQSISFTLNAGFQQREGHRIETERTTVNFVQLVHRGREKRKNRKEVSSC